MLDRELYKEREPSPSERIVVTGMGTVNPLGLNVEETWEALMEGKSGIKELDPPIEDSPINIAGKVENFEPSNFVAPKELRRTHRTTHLVYGAISEALADASYSLDQDGKIADVDPNRIGIRIGTGIGGATHIQEIQQRIQEGKNVQLASMLIVLPERTSTSPGIKFGIKGPTASTSAACATGSVAITDSLLRIWAGDADLMLAGGAEASVDKLTILSFHALGDALSKNGSFPFDERADGFVMSEGAGVLVLERLSNVIKSGREKYIKAEINGYGDTADAYHATAPSGEGAERAIRIALKRARIDPREVDYINAHGTGTKLGDPKELEAIANVFGENLDKLSVSSTKGAFGHLLGAAGAVEAIVTIQSIVKNKVPPTINLDKPIRRDIDLVPKAKEKNVNIAGSGSFGFGGINSFILFKRYSPNL